MRKFYFFILIAMFAVATNAKAITVDDLVGSYVENTSGQDYWNWTSWVDFTQTANVTISKVDENTVTVYNLYNWGTELTGTVDLTAMTITLQSQAFGYYVFCGYPWDESGAYSSENPVVATISDDGQTIEIGSWALAYPEYYESAYVSAYSVLTKVKEAASLWTATGSYDAGDKGVGTAGITAYDDGSYTMTGFPAADETLTFSLDDSGKMVYVGGSGSMFAGYKGVWYYDAIEDGDIFGLFADDDEAVFDIAEEGGTISFGYEYYDPSDNDTPAVTDTYTFTWGNKTGISSVKTDASAVKAAVYNLSGVKVAESADGKLAKGLYISGGKKFVVK